MERKQRSSTSRRARADEAKKVTTGTRPTALDSTRREETQIAGSLSLPLIILLLGVLLSPIIYDFWQALQATAAR